jgi:hypothetical protein
LIRVVLVDIPKVLLSARCIFLTVMRVFFLAVTRIFFLTAMHAFFLVATDRRW